MSEATELVRAILGAFCRTDEDAEAILAAARAAGVDTLDFCAHHYGLGEAAVAERAAAWANLFFSPVVPRLPTADGAARLDIRRLDALAGVRSMREIFFGREVTFLAPRFEQMVHFREYVRRHPEVRRSLCIAPASSIRTALAKTAEAELLDESRQRLARRWPFASADLDLGRLARVAFVGIAVALVLLATLAPLVLQTVLLPLLGIVLIAPAVFRLVAVLAPPEASRRPPAPLVDRDLPIYTILIPLRDEAHMVPQLQRAMVRLDYPALCSKLKNPLYH